MANSIRLSDEDRKRLINEDWLNRDDTGKVPSWKRYENMCREIRSLVDFDNVSCGPVVDAEGHICPIAQALIKLNVMDMDHAIRASGEDEDANAALEEMVIAASQHWDVSPWDVDGLVSSICQVGNIYPNLRYVFLSYIEGIEPPDEYVKDTWLLELR